MLCPLLAYDVHFEGEHLGYRVTWPQADLIRQNNNCGYSDLALAGIF